MLGRWIRQWFWRPFELACRVYPLVPLRAEVTRPADGIVCIRIDNVVTKLLSRFGGGFDYAVCYLIDGTLLLDTGFPWARRTLRKVLIELGADKTIRQVVNSHYHEDHTGNNDMLADLTGAEILAHPLAVSEIRYPATLPWYRHFLFGPVHSSEVRPVGIRVQTANFTFDVHHMPGHCPGHTCLFEPSQRWLFSDDLYIAADLDSQLNGDHGPAWIASLDRAIALSPAYIFDALGVIIQGEDNVHELLVRKREFLGALRQRVLYAADKAASICDITRQAFRHRDIVDRISFSDGWLSLLTGSDFSRGNLVKSFLREPVFSSPDPSPPSTSPPTSSAPCSPCSPDDQTIAARPFEGRNGQGVRHRE